MITIGIPVFNEGKYIVKTINSVINQASKIIVSDNHSTDDTYDILQTLEQKHPNLDCYYQDVNLGMLENFKFCLDQANTKYFMWLGAHDLVSENYVAGLVGLLEQNPDAVMAYTPVDRINSEGELLYTLDYSISSQLYVSEDLFERAFTIINHFEEAAIFHGIFRTEILKESFVKFRCLGPDLVILCKAATYGKFLYQENERFIRRFPRVENSKEAETRWIRQLLRVDEKEVYDPYFSFKSQIVDIFKNIDINNNSLKAQWIQKVINVLTSKRGEFQSPSYLKNYWFHKSITESNGITNVLKLKNISNVAVFGTGRLAIYLYHDLVREDIKVETFLANKLEQLETIHDIQVRSLFWLKENHSIIDAVIVTIEGEHDQPIIKRIRQLVGAEVPVYSWKDIIKENLCVPL